MLGPALQFCRKQQDWRMGNSSTHGTTEPSSESAVQVELPVAVTKEERYEPISTANEAVLEWKNISYTVVNAVKGFDPNFCLFYILDFL